MNKLRIGTLEIDPPILSAPLAGFSTYAFRQILRRFGGVGLITSEMVSARGFIQIEKRKGDFPDRLWGVKEEPRPLSVQIWDNDPEKLAEVGRRLAHEFAISVVDINFGCPAGDIAEKAESGSFLLRDPQRLGDLVARVVAACTPVPVTAKIRLGLTDDTINAADVAQAVENAGGAALTVHGRTAEQFYRGFADWERIAEVKKYLKRIPLIGNGDLRTPDDAVQAFERFGVDGIMVGRAGLSRPWLFRQMAAALKGEPIPPEATLAEQRDLLEDHFKMVVAQHGAQRATVQMRAFACLYAKGRAGARTFREKIAKVKSPEEFFNTVHALFPVD